jgi:predicted protein tyrosine phosphatase
MKDIEVLNRNILTFMDKNPEFYPEKDFALIRFFNPGHPYKLKLPTQCKGSLEIICDDVSNIKMEKAHRYVFFDEEMAEKIVHFVKKHKDNINTLICACEAGISRSAGCAAAFSKFYFDDDKIFYSSQYFPNSLIYRTILYKLHNEKR